VLTKEAIVKLLEDDDRAVARALVVLNDRQTQDEQSQETTKYQNGRGFRPAHARMGTSMAQFFKARGYLTPKQLAYWRARDKKGNMRIGIYWAQLLEEAQLKAARKAEMPVENDSKDPKKIDDAQSELDQFMTRVRKPT